jgi:formylglycine-generating enzyme required for sulfatase activity
MIGSEDSDAYRDEKRVHRVTMSSFWMDGYEVTVEQFRRFCTETGRQFPEQPSWNGENHPVVNVTWDDANAYCEWAGERLPTEAEWEYAARGGLEGKKYPWGDSFDSSKANRDGKEDGYEYTSPVGSFPANGYGLHDMAGNAREWCRDWYGDYSPGSGSNPQGPASGDMRVLRGGSWDDIPKTLRVSCRDGNYPDSRSDIGFRCAKDK